MNAHVGQEQPEKPRLSARRRGRFLRSLGSKVLILTILVTFINDCGMVIFYARQQEESILEDHHQSLRKLTESIAKGLEALMIDGYADVARNYVEMIKTLPYLDNFYILRTNGMEAFLDNETIDRVNRRLGEEEFLPRELEIKRRKLAENDPLLRQMLESRRSISYETGEGKEAVLTLIVPILNGERCRKCHGSEFAVRGVVTISTSLKTVRQEIAKTRLRAIVILFIVLVGGSGLIYLLLRYSIVKPIRFLSDSMERVAHGDYHSEVPVKGGDELARIARTFNEMTQQIRLSQAEQIKEKNKLTSIINGAMEGIIVTDAEDRIMIVNPLAEKLLGKSRRQIVQDGFSQAFDDPDLLRKAIRPHTEESPPQIVIYKRRTLQVSLTTIHNEREEKLGSTAMIRDITEEKRLEDKLRAMAYTDMLTGLNNRRWLHEILGKEFKRVRRHEGRLALLCYGIVDYENFCRNYGQGMGNSAVMRVGSASLDAFRESDHCCREEDATFCLIMPETNADGAIEAAQRLQKQAQETPEGIPFTIRFGVAAYPDNLTYNPEELWRLARKALAEAMASKDDLFLVAPPTEKPNVE
ncbi:MAG: diguanylate cyclase with PAS/PAC sensor [Magnetococcales bacterium]|nr:diguanylate cyclase with PAS/PAC sensor [Magnetococcales bacterium]